MVIPQVVEVTKEYLKERNLASFARGLGLPKASRTMVWQWKEGRQTPDHNTLIRVLYSPTAENWARLWAADILKVYSEQAQAQTQPEQPGQS